MSERAMPTRGRARVIGVVGDLEVIVGPDHDFIPIASVHHARDGKPEGSPDRDTAFSNADLIAAAFNSATAAADMGFDPIGAVEQLSALLIVAQNAECTCTEAPGLGLTCPRCVALSAARTRLEVSR